MALTSGARRLGTPASSRSSGSTASMLEQFIQWLLNGLLDLGYPGSVLLMAMESSIPAGIARMPLRRFIGYTGLGAFAWCSILVAIGYLLGRNEGVLRQAEVQHYVSRALLIVLPILALGVGVYALRQRRRAPSGD